MSSRRTTASGARLSPGDAPDLLPAVIQDWRDGTVLMLGFMNAAALRRTQETGRVHFWSRSRRRLWEKGETSGHTLFVKDLFIDCDEDTILVKAEPVGPTCHTGARACFFRRLSPDGRVRPSKTNEAFGGLLERLADTIASRKRRPSPDSYVSTLLQAGPDRMLKKVVEEAGEVVLAAKNGRRDEVIHEVADLLFHTLVVLGHQRISVLDVYTELGARFGKPGLRKPVRREAPPARQRTRRRRS